MIEFWGALGAYAPMNPAIDSKQLSVRYDVGFAVLDTLVG